MVVIYLIACKQLVTFNQQTHGIAIAPRQVASLPQQQFYILNNLAHL